jgi:hypothetical protein
MGRSVARHKGLMERAKGLSPKFLSRIPPEKLAGIKEEESTGGIVLDLVDMI